MAITTVNSYLTASGLNFREGTTGKASLLLDPSSDKINLSGNFNLGTGSFTIGGNAIVTGASAIDSDTLQTVTDRGNTTTTSVFVEGQYLSGVSGLFSDKVNIGTPVGTHSCALEVAGIGSQIIVADTASVAAGVGGAIDFFGVYGAAGERTSFGRVEAKKTDAIGNNYGAGLALSTRVHGGGSLTERITILESGNVGIGTANPAELLHLRGGAATQIIDSATNESSLKLKNTSTECILKAANAHFVTMLGGSERMRITSAGDVGIGTTAPSGLLHVDGDIVLSSGSALKSIGGAGVFQTLEFYSPSSSENWSALKLGGQEFFEPRVGNNSYLYGFNSVRIQPTAGCGKAGQASFSFGSDSETYDVTTLSMGYAYLKSTNDAYCALSGYKGIDFGATEHAPPQFGRWTQNGLAIGHTVPTVELDVAGSGKFYATEVNMGTFADPAITFSGTTHGIYAPNDSSLAIKVHNAAYAAMTIGTNNIQFGGGGDSKLSWSTNTYLELNGGGTKAHLNTDGLGIGTTSPASKLHVRSPDSNVLRLSSDEALYDDSQEIGIDFYGRWYSSQTSVLKARASIVALGDIDGYSRGQLSFRVANDAVPSEVVRIDRQGNVGIGLTNPVHTLHVSGSVAGTGVAGRITLNGTGYLLSGDSPAETQTLQQVTDNGSTTTNAIGIATESRSYISGNTNTNTPPELLRIANGGLQIYNKYGGAAAITGALKSALFIRGIYEGPAIVSAGNVAISSHGGKFGVESGSRNEGGDLEYGLGTYDNVRSKLWTQGGTEFYSTADGLGADPTVTFSNNNVGIGTSVPAGVTGWSAYGRVLHITDPTQNQPHIRLSQGHGVDAFFGVNPTKAYLGTSTAKKISFVTDLTDAITIDESQNVGIGTTAPITQLDVVGTGLFSSRVGIGTDAPTQPLEVVGNAMVDTLTIQDGSTAINRDGSVLRLYANAGTDISTWFDGYHKALSVRKSASDALIGINNGSPSYQLDVNGTGYFANGVLGTGVGNRITNNGVPYLLSGDSPAETQTLQDVTTNGDTTTTNIISEKIVSGVSGLFSDAVGIGTTTPLGLFHVDERGGASSSTNYGIVSDINGGANSTNIAGYFSSTNTSVNVALRTVGRNEFGGVVTVREGYIDQRSDRNSQMGNIFVGDTTAGYIAGNGGTIVFAGDALSQGVASATFASIRGVKENGSYNNSLGALVFGTQDDAGSNQQLDSVSEKMRISSDGKVGIGTTAPSLALLQVEEDGGEVLIGSPTTSYGGIGFDTTFTVDNAALFGLAGYTIIGVKAGGQIQHKIGNLASQGLLKQTAGQLTYTDGDVGIGTGAPAVTLDVNGNMRIRNNYDGDYWVQWMGVHSDSRMRLRDSEDYNIIQVRPTSNMQMFGEGQGSNDDWAFGARAGYAAAAGLSIGNNLMGSVGTHKSLGISTPQCAASNLTSAPSDDYIEFNTYAVTGNAAVGVRPAIRMAASGFDFHADEENRGFNDDPHFSINQAGYSYFTGSVGIGTTNPNGALHVNVENTRQLLFTRSATGPLATDGTYMGQNGTDFSIINQEAGDLYLGTSNTDRVIIEAGGDVGIGTTLPSSKLDVAGIIRSTNSNAGEIALFNASQERASFKDANTHASLGASVAMPLHFRTNNTDWAAIGAGGLFSIGTTTPQTNTALTIQGKNTAPSWSALKVQDSVTGNLFTVLNDGNVGIGTSNPAYELDVNGTIHGTSGNFETAITINGNPVLTGVTDANTYVTSASFNTSDGVLTLTRNDSATVTVDLDGKYQDEITSSSRLSATLIGANGNVSNTEYGYLNGVTSAIQTQLGAKQATLTFGIANTNAVKIDSASVADNDYTKFTANGLEGRSFSEVKTDLSLSNVENTALSTWAGSSNITTVGTISAGTWQGTAIADGYISSASTWNAKQAALTFGIANTNAVKIDSASVADNEYARFTANGLESRSTSEVLSDIGAGTGSVGSLADLGVTATSTELNYVDGVTSAIQTQLGAKQATLTFGIANTNAVKIDSASVADNEFARFTADGLESRSASEVRSDLSLGSLATLSAVDADSVTLSNVEVDNFKASAIVTEAEGIGSNDNDTSLPTSAAVIDYVANTIIPDTNTFVTGASFNTSDGVLTLTRNDSATVTADLDGKYQNEITSSTRLSATLIGANGNVSNTEYGYLNGVTSAIQTQLNAKQATLTFGISDDNAVQIDSASVADNDYAKFTSNGLEGRSSTEAKSDLSLNNVENTALSTWAGSSNITTVGTISAGTWQGTAIADGYISSASTWNAKQAALTFGIANTNAVKIDSASVADNEYARFTANGLESRSTSEVLSDIGAGTGSVGSLADLGVTATSTELNYVDGVTSAIQTQLGAKQATLTFGIANTNAVKIDSASVADNDYTKFTANGLEGRSFSEVKSDLSLNSVENTALSTWAGSSNVTTVGTISAGTWQGTAIADGYISSASTWNAKQAALTFGIANTNAVKIDSASVADNEYARFTANGLESRSASEVRSDLSLGSLATLSAIDADSVTVSNLEIDNFKASAIITEAEGIASNDNDTTVPTSAAVIDYVVNTIIPDTNTYVTAASFNTSDGVLTLTRNDAGTVTADLDGKYQDQITSSSRLNANLIGANGNVSNTEYGYLNGVTSAIQTQLGAKQATLTFGISDDNTVQIDSASVADNDYAKFTANGLEGRSFTEIKSDLSLSNVENTALSTWGGSSNITTVGTISAGTWQGTAIADGYISSASTWNAKQAALTFGIGTDNVLRSNGTMADNEFLKVDGTQIEGRSSAELKSDLSLNNVENTALSTWAGSSNITTVGTISAGTWQGTAIADGYISSASTWNAKQAALTFGIANTNAVKIDSASVADNEYARFTANGLESRSTSEVLSDIGAGTGSVGSLADLGVTATSTELNYVDGVTSAIQTQLNAKQATLTFGIANTNAVKIDSASAADNDYAKFTANGLEGRSFAEAKTDLSLNNVENTALSTWVGTSNITTVGTIGAGTWQGTAIADGYISSASTWNAKQAALTFGIANTNAVKIDSASVADNEYARFTANGLESRSTSEVLSDIGAGTGSVGSLADLGVTATSTELNYVDGVTSAIQTQLGAKQATLTFGIANTNAVKIDSASVADNDYTKFTANGLEGRSFSEVKSDLSLNNVENTALSTWAGSSNITTVGTISAGLTVTAGVAIGASYAAVTAPTNGAIIQGNVGIGTNNPAATLDVEGIIKNKVYAIGSLPSASPAGQRAFVNNNYYAFGYYTLGQTVYAGGSSFAPVYSDGSYWRLG